MAITSYTAYSDVRAVLGVTDNELPDSVLGLSVYDLNLTAELETIEVTLPTVYATFADVDPSTLTAVQLRFYNATRLFATYSVAKQLGSALPMFSPKEMTDGKSAMQRFGVNPYQDTIDRIDKQYNVLIDRLATAFVPVSTSAYADTLRTYFIAAQPTSDRVTG